MSSLEFNPENPFPFLEKNSHTYLEAQLHSEKVDRELGLQTEMIEKTLLQNTYPATQRLWIGLPTRSLLTPYTEIRTLLEQLQPQAGNLILDLGAGYGRMGFVIHRHFSEVRFIGYEYVRERVLEGNRGYSTHIRSDQIQLFQADLSSPEFEIPKADFYFIYDFGSRTAIEQVFDPLKKTARIRPITVIGRGRLVRDLIERHQPWLSQIVSPIHEAHYSIYRTEIR